MNVEGIVEFRTTWNNELFAKHRVACRTAKRLIKKSSLVIHTRLCRQLKYTENHLIKEHEAVRHQRELLNNQYHSTSLAEGLQQRLKVLQHEIDHYNLRIKSLVKQEKEYWKQLEQTIVKRTTTKLASSPSASNTRPRCVVNATFVTHVDKNNENLPPFGYNSKEMGNKSPVKVPKIRKKKKQVS